MKPSDYIANKTQHTSRFLSAASAFLISLLIIGTLLAGCGSDTTAPTESETEQETATVQSQRNGFDSNTNVEYTLGCYTVEIPSYWDDGEKNLHGTRWYAETGSKVAMLEVITSPETDENYSVTFDGLLADNENMIFSLESTFFTKVTDYEIVDTGVVKGILYTGSLVDSKSNIAGFGEWFIFASESDRTWCSITLAQSDNTVFLYDDDFMCIINSIKGVPESTQQDDTISPEESAPPSTIVLPEPDTKLGNDFDSKGSSTAYYINVDGSSNKPELQTWGNATITDGVAEYLNHLQELGFSVVVTDFSSKSPYSGYTMYETNFEISNQNISWTMSLNIQSEKYVEYELEINLN